MWLKLFTHGWNWIIADFFGVQVLPFDVWVPIYQWFIDISNDHLTCGQVEGGSDEGELADWAEEVLWRKFYNCQQQ